MSKIEISNDGVNFTEVACMKLGEMGNAPMPPLDEPPDISVLFASAFLLGFKVSREGFNAECPYEHLAPDHLSSMRDLPRETMAEFAELMGESKAFNSLLNEALVQAGLTPF